MFKQLKLTALTTVTWLYIDCPENNDSKDTSKLANDWFNKNKIRVLESEPVVHESVLQTLKKEKQNTKLFRSDTATTLISDE